MKIYSLLAILLIFCLGKLAKGKFSGAIVFAMHMFGIIQLNNYQSSITLNVLWDHDAMKIVPVQTLRRTTFCE